MFGSNLHTAAQVVPADRFEIAAGLRVDKKVVTEAAFDEDVFDARQGAQFSVKGKAFFVNRA
jgi:hypothetical protein